jgi:hypothetical protein
MGVRLHSSDAWNGGGLWWALVDSRVLLCGSSAVRREPRAKQYNIYENTLLASTQRLFVISGSMRDPIFKQHLEPTGPEWNTIDGGTSGVAGLTEY